MINGVIVKPLKQIGDNRGKVMHMLRSDSDLFTRFGEVYFSLVYPHIVKAWKRHFKMTQNLAVPVGKIRLVIFDSRPASSTCNNIEVIEIGEDNYDLVKIPPEIWYGFMGISEKPSLIANCADLTHDPNEMERIDDSDPRIPYRWKG